MYRGGVRFPYEVFKDADYAKSGEVTVRQLTLEEREKYMGMEITREELLGNTTSQLAVKYNVSKRTVERAKAAVRNNGKLPTIVEIIPSKSSKEVSDVVEPVIPAFKEESEGMLIESDSIGEDTSNMVTVQDYLDGWLKARKDKVVNTLGPLLANELTDDLKMVADVLLYSMSM